MVYSAQCIYVLEVIYSINSSLLLRFTLFGSARLWFHYFEQELHIYWNYDYANTQIPVTPWIYGTSHMDGSSFHFILEWFGLVWFGLVWFGLLVISFHCTPFVWFLFLLRDVDRVVMSFGSCHSLCFRVVDIDSNRIFDTLCSCQICKWTKLCIRTRFSAHVFFSKKYGKFM